MIMNDKVRIAKLCEIKELLIEYRKGTLTADSIEGIIKKYELLPASDLGKETKLGSLYYLRELYAQGKKLRFEDPWEKRYRRMREEIPSNETEKKVMEILGKGGAISECRDVWKEGGLKEEDFDGFMKKVSEKESELFCGGTGESIC
ncbi:MAG: hypothetical protein K6F99_10390 [Lachnospiraceae bacterium]|nr:hypothetical protein [Lachnospiraceae bacterium]